MLTNTKYYSTSVFGFLGLENPALNERQNTYPLHAGFEPEDNLHIIKINSYTWF